MKKLSFIVALLCTSMMAFADAAPSGELFATYQKQGDRFYEGSNEADKSAAYLDISVNYYIVTCGDSILLRATTTEEGNLGSGYQTQLRVWSGVYGNSNEIQVNAGDGKNRYTSICRNILPTTEDVNIHLFLDWSGWRVTETFNFNRASINNPIVDTEAPSIDPTDVTMTDVEGTLVFTFGDVTSDDEFFYYVADKNHNIGGISLTNKVYITKPTVEDGTTYTFKCYAVDYNGNKSAYKEFTLTMPVNTSTNLALNKTCEAGGAENGHGASLANDGNKETYWGTYGVGNWLNTNIWTVDLGLSYDLNKVSVYTANFDGVSSHVMTLEGKKKLDDSWTTIFNNLTVEKNQSYENVSANASARYLKISFNGNGMIAIKEFEVYGTGLTPVTPPTPTDIENTEAEVKAIKVIENGQLIIIKNGVRYNVAGQQVK